MSTSGGDGGSEYERRVLDALEREFDAVPLAGVPAAGAGAVSWSRLIGSFILLVADGLVLAAATHLGSAVLTALAIALFPLVALPLLRRGRGAADAGGLDRCA